MTSEIVLLFPGQGSQFVGMGLDLFENFSAAREVFERVDLALGRNLSEIMFKGGEAELTLTQNTQPALLTASMATLAAIGKTPECKYMAGHSLGEYSALCASGALSLEDAVKLVEFRGQAMQRAVPSGVGSMAAILGMKIGDIKEITEKAGCFIANDNAVGQVVISGEKSAVENACKLAKETGAKRALPLPVSAPFHCELMQEAAIEMKQMLESTDIKPPKVPVISNVSVEPQTDPNKIRALLVAQITGQVKWRQTMTWLSEHGVTSALEIGSGAVLSGLARRGDVKIPCKSIGSLKSVKEYKNPA